MNKKISTKVSLLDVVAYHEHLREEILDDDTVENAVALELIKFHDDAISVLSGMFGMENYEEVCNECAIWHENAVHDTGNWWHKIAADHFMNALNGDVFSPAAHAFAMLDRVEGKKSDIAKQARQQAELTLDTHHWGDVYTITA